MLTKNEEIAILKSVGNKVKKLREAKGLSQHDLSIEADIPKNQVGRIERAEINTTIISLFKISKALQVDLKDIINQTP